MCFINQTPVIHSDSFGHWWLMHWKCISSENTAVSFQQSKTLYSDLRYFFIKIIPFNCLQYQICHSAPRSVIYQCRQVYVLNLSNYFRSLDLNLLRHLHWFSFFVESTIIHCIVFSKIFLSGYLNGLLFGGSKLRTHFMAGIIFLGFKYGTIL